MSPGPHTRVLPWRRQGRWALPETLPSLYPPSSPHSRVPGGGEGTTTTDRFESGDLGSQGVGHPLILPV